MQPALSAKRLIFLDETGVTLNMVRRYPPVVIAVVSGAIKPSMTDLPERAFFVPKPFDPRHVLAEIERLA